MQDVFCQVSRRSRLICIPDDHKLALSIMETGKKEYPVVASEYRLMEEIGHGRSATVYRALCVPLQEILAIKCVDLEKCKDDLDEVRREAQTMSLIDHPNVVTAYTFFIVDQNLWVVMPYMAGGSCLNIMRVGHPHGLDEPVVATVLRESLKALEYLHFHGHIHRDIKAGNILIDAYGIVKLGDFGVAACLFDCHNRQLLRRTTFVGTPCWMAPEVLDPVCGYDCKADIWSLGITALELAQGHAPFSKLPPMKLLQMQLLSGPPSLDDEKSKSFSKSFKDFVGCCLHKEPVKRLTAAKLLKHPFFKHARTPEYLVQHLLTGLPPLWEQVKELKIKDAAVLAKRLSMPHAGENSEDPRHSLSGWNFDIGGPSSSRKEPIPEGDEEEI